MRWKNWRNGFPAACPSPCSGPSREVVKELEPTVPPNGPHLRDGMADTYHGEVIIRVLANLDSTMVTRLFTDSPIAS